MILQEYKKNIYVYREKKKSFFDGDLNFHEINRKRKNRPLTTEIFIIKAKKRHGNKYDYSDVQYINRSRRVIIRCIEHNKKFSQTPTNHLSGVVSCPICNSNIRPAITYDEFIKRVNDLYGNKYDYSKTTFNHEYDKIEIVCKKHGLFKRIVKKHILGQGCPRCISIEKKNNSVGELMIKNWLENNSIEFETQKTFDDCSNVKLLKFDFYLPKQNILIEFDGRQHFEPVECFGGHLGFIKQQKNDNIKNEYCQANNIKLLRITYKKIKNISSILKNNIVIN